MPPDRSKPQAVDYSPEDESDEERNGEPGPLGRWKWFVERAGTTADALSIDRLSRAIRLAEGMGDMRSLRNSVVEEALGLLDGMSTTARRRLLKQSVLIKADGTIRSLKTAPTTGGQGITAASEPLSVPDRGIAFIPLDPRVATHLDLGALVAADTSDARQLRLNSTFTYLPAQFLVVGRILKPGRYQLFALPKDPRVRTTLETIARHWKWVERVAPSSDKTAERRRSDLLHRMCHIVLCDQDGEASDEGFAGTGGPPGEWLAGSEGGQLCDRCADVLLGPLNVIDGSPLRPPVIKWWWDDKWWPDLPQYLHWSSVGPFPTTSIGYLPNPDFSGVGRVTQIDIHPTDGNILIAGAAGGGVWRTENGGSWWRSFMISEPTQWIGAVAIAPSNPMIMYAASGEDAGGLGPAWSGLGVYRSADLGVHWTLMTSVASTRFSAVAVHPREPDTVYVAGNRGLHKSRDGGATWLTNPGQSSLFDGRITDLVIGHERPVAAQAWIALPPVEPIFAERVYMGVRDDGVYRSTTGGQQYGLTPAFERLDGTDQLPSGSDAGWPKLAIGRRGVHGSRFLAAKLGPAGELIFTSADGGTTWTEKASGVAAWPGAVAWSSLIAVDPTDEDIMYAGGAGKFFRTTNGGAVASDWTYIREQGSPPFPHSDQQDLVFHPRDPRRIFLANDGGVYRSNNRGDDWTFVSALLAITQVYDIDVSEGDRDIISVAAQDNGIFYRNAAGAWRNLRYGDGTQVAIDPTDPQIIYFANQNGIPTGLARSLDGGASRQDLAQTGLSGSSPFVTVIKLEPRPDVTDPASNRVLFVCGSNELFRSTDGGQSWARVEDTSGTPFQSVGTITALEFAPSNRTILYLGTSEGALYRAVNGGVNANDWSRIDTSGSVAQTLFPETRVQAIGVNAADANHVWLVFGGDGVTASSRPDMVLNPLGISHLFRNPNVTDQSGWEDASGQLATMSLPDVPTSAVALADFDPMVAYVGTDVGVFRTTDGGLTWAALQDGLPRCPVVELRFHRGSNRLFAGTMGRGVYVRDLV